MNIHWFREDLRLTDNLSLIEASKENVLPIYIFNENSVHRRLGQASKVWLHQSLSALNQSLDGQLKFFKGDPKDIFKMLINQFKISGIYWNNIYQPSYLKEDMNLSQYLLGHNIKCNSFNSSNLWEPGSIVKKDGAPYKVFTPYYQKGCLSSSYPRVPKLKPEIKFVDTQNNIGVNLDDLKLIPQKNSWHLSLIAKQSIGEIGAKKKLNEFIEDHVESYSLKRNYPSEKGGSELSAHIHFGELSVNQIWHALEASGKLKIEPFRRQLVWREFSYHLLINFPNLPSQNLQSKFDNFPWDTNQAGLQAWQKGQTGIPIVDAGMRELWKTGRMHNRLRMIVGSFLVKNLRIDWRVGEAWFWDCLFDANLANNVAGWQWVAGTGADAAPYFRIFNPKTQGEKFDAKGEYTRKFVPELERLPIKYLFSPWEAPEDVLNKAGVKLGDNYPQPIVDLKESRLKALDAFQSIRVSK